MRDLFDKEFQKEIRLFNFRGKKNGKQKTPKKRN